MPRFDEVTENETGAIADVNVIRSTASQTHGGKEAYNDNGNSGASATIDLANGNYQKITLTANCTLSFTNLPSTDETSDTIGGSFVLIVVQDGTGSRTVTWPASVDWAGATAPTLSTGANDVDIFTFLSVDGGTTHYGGTFGLDFG